MAEEKKNFLQGWREVLNQLSDEKDAERKQTLAMMGPPAQEIDIPDEDHPDGKVTYGLWPGVTMPGGNYEKGVGAIIKRKNGYHPNEMRYYSETFIKGLVKILEETHYAFAPKEEKPMKAFECSFHGHWPIGACGVIFAPNKESAKSRLKTWLKNEGLLEKNQDKDDITIEELDPKKAAVHILNDGQY